MAAEGVYQSNLVPARSTWSSTVFTEDDCVDAIGRAAEHFSNPTVIADVSRRLGMKVDQVPVGVGIVSRVDANFDDVGQPNYPAFMLFPQIAEYLSIDPDIEGVRFKWTLGVFNDSIMGPVPVIFLATENGSTQRLVALIWSFAKERDRDHFGYLLQARIGEEIQERGMEGGMATIYQVGFVVHGDSGGLDLLAMEYFIPWKTWFTLSTSVYMNAVAEEFQKTAVSWPHPVDLSSDGIFSSPGAGGFKSWY